MTLINLHSYFCDHRIASAALSMASIRTLIRRTLLFDSKSYAAFLARHASTTSTTSKSHHRAEIVGTYNHSRWYFNKLYYAGTIPVGVLAYFLYKRKSFDFNILPVVQAATIPSLRSRYNFIADVVQSSSAGVVCIEIKNNITVDFFGWAPQTNANGSGFFVDDSGLILTNAHVVMGHPQTAIKVKLADGTMLPAKVEDVDEDLDLASLRVKPKGKITALKLGETKTLRPGEWVIAMGSPLTLANSVTAGIVSSVNRTSSELQLFGKTDMRFIQTDACVTFGNSGGPLINLDGEVVGINAMKSYQPGISFAIPVEYAKEFLERSKNRKQKAPSAELNKQRYLGVTLFVLNDDMIRELRYRNFYLPPGLKEGVMVWKIVTESPAHTSGLLPGDIITEINGIPARSSNALYEALEKDSTLRVRFYRGHSYFEAIIQPEDVRTVW